MHKKISFGFYKSLYMFIYKNSTPISRREILVIFVIYLQKQNYLFSRTIKDDDSLF